MRHTPRSTLAGAVVLLASLALDAGETPPPTSAPPAPPAPFYLIVDYLSVALYEKEPLTACFRIENTTGQEGEVEVRATILDASDKELRTDKEKLRPAGKGFATYQKDHDLRGVAKVRFTVVTPAGELPGPALRLIRLEDPWPAAAVRDGRVVSAETGEALVPVARRRLKSEDRAWAPLKWALAAREQPEGEKVRSAFLLLPAALAPGQAPPPAGAGGPPAAVELVPERARATERWRTLGPYALDGSPPILRAAGDALRALPSAPPERLVLLLPPEDLEVATDPRVYAVLLEVVLARAAAAGVRQTILAPPFHFGVSRKRQETLWRVVREAAEIYLARVLEPEEFLDEKLWRADPAVEGVYARQPNADGRKRIAQKLSDLLP